MIPAWRVRKLVLTNPMHNILKLRSSLKLTQVQAARLIGVTANTWARWERGEVTPSSTAIKLIEMLPVLAFIDVQKTTVL